MEKKTFSVRFVAGAAALCLTAAFAGPSPAGAQTAPGVGTSTASHTLFDFEVGEAGRLLGLEILADKARSTIDSNVGPSKASSTLVPLSLTSGVLPILNEVTAKLPTFEASSDGQTEVSGSALNLASPGGVAGIPLNLLGGELVPNKLTANLDGLGARSTLDAALAKLSVVSGLVTLDSVTNKLGTSAALPRANGTRALDVGAISVLDLGDLLGLLGLDLAMLPLDKISALLGALKLPVALPADSATLLAAVDGLLADISAVNAAVADATELLDDPVSTVAPVNELLPGLPTQLVPANGSALVPTGSLALPTGTVENLLATLQGTLESLLGNALSALDDVALIEVGGATVSASTTAADTLANSTADVTAAIRDVKVLDLTLPGVDLTTVGTLVSAATKQLNGVLGILGLENVVDLDVLAKSTSLTTANGYNNALAGIDVLSLKVTPPKLLADLVKTLTGTVGLSSIGKLSAAGVANPLSSLPVLGGGALALDNLLNLPDAVGALTEGLSLKVGSVRSASQFRLASAPAPASVAAPVGDTLPRTGGETGTLGILAAGMAAVALGVRRWARRPQMD